MKRVFRKDTYNMKILNPNGQQSGIRKLTVDGKEINGNRFKNFGDGLENEMKFEM